MKTDQLGSRGAAARAIDPNRTRTADVRVTPEDAASASGTGRAHSENSRTDQTTDQPTEVVDEAAISFARERERVLARLDHGASVARLRRALTLGFPVWVATVPLDWVVLRTSNDGSFATFLCVRGLVALVIVVAMLRLYRPPEPSVPALWFYDMLTFTAAAAGVSVVSMAFRGIESPYGPAVVLVMLARGATTLAHWRQGAWLFAAPGLAYPVTVAIAARLNPAIRAQIEHPATRVNLYVLLYMIVVCWMMLVLGGHFAWQLRRQVIEVSNIGRYKLLRRLGSGGGGEVWAAFDTTLRQRVALKTVAGHRPGSPVLARLEREVRALSELTHPNTVRIFDYGTTDDGLWYYAMELLHGENLQELVLREGPLSNERVASIARQVLRALGEAHDKGIVHRDIKPANVFVAQMGGDSEVVKLIDFGIASTSGDSKLTRTGFVPGTPAYMCPEAIVGHPVDVRSDIYSFGATLYFALTGRLPFQEEDPMALFAAHVSLPVRPMSTVSSRPIPLAVERVVERCMAKDPAQRYASTSALLGALSAFEIEGTGPI